MACMVLLGASCQKILEKEVEPELNRLRFETTELYSGYDTWISEDSVETWRFLRLYHPASESYGFHQPASYEFKGYCSHWPGNVKNATVPTTEFSYSEDSPDSITLEIFVTEQITLYRYYEDGILQIGNTKYYRK